MKKHMEYLRSLGRAFGFGKFLLVSFVFLSVFLLSSSLAYAAKSTTWALTTGGLWTTPESWSNGVPSTGDTVIFTQDLSSNVTAVPTISLASLTLNGTMALVPDANGNTITVTGALSVATGKTITFGAGGTGNTLNLTLSGTATGTINGTGVLYSSTELDDFTLSNSATLYIANVNGISANGNYSSGAIQFRGNHHFDVNANYIYNYSGSQSTGNGLPTSAITGNVNVASGTSLSSTNAIIVDIPGTLTVNGTLTPGAATQVFSGTGTLTGTGTVKVNRTTATAGFLNQYTESTKTLTNLTVEYTVPAGGQVVSSTTYGNLTLDNTSGTNTAGGNVTINGILTTEAGGTLNMGSNDLLGSLTTITNNGTIETQSTDSAPIPAGKSWGGTVLYDLSGGGQNVANGTYNNLTLGNTSGSQAAIGDVSVSGTLIVPANATLDMNGHNLTLLSGSTGSIDRTGLISGSGSNFTLSSGATLNIANSAGITSSGASGAVQVSGDRTFSSGANYTYSDTIEGESTGSGLPTSAITGNVNVASGTNLLATNAITIDSPGALTVNGILDMGTNQLGGTLTNIANNGIIKTQNIDASPIPSNETWGGTGTVEYNSASSQTIANGDYYNLTATAPSGNRTLFFNLGTTQTIEGTLTLIGNAVNLLRLRSTSDDHTWYINPKDGMDINYVDVEDSYNVSSEGINPPNSHNSGRNHNWFTQIISATIEGSGGTLTPLGDLVIDYGSSETYTASTDVHYHIVYVNIDGVATGDAVNRRTYTYTFNNVTANHSIDAGFALNAPTSETWLQTTGGSWADGGNWSSGIPPQSGDHVIIDKNQSADITGVPSITLANLTVTGTAALVPDSASSITVEGTLDIGSGVMLTLGTGSSASNSLGLTVSSVGIIEGTGYVYSDNPNSDFNLSSGATLEITNSDGISSSGNSSSGAIRVAGNHNFDSGANYVYNAVGDQSAGAGLPTITGSLTVTGGTNLLATNAITINSPGALTVNGILNMGTNQLGGTLTNIANNGTLKTQNTNATPIPANMTWGGTVEYNSASSQTIANGDYNNLTATGGSRTLFFNAGMTQTIEGTMALVGTSPFPADLLRLRSSVTDTQWYINPQGAKNVDYLSVEDSINVSSEGINPPDSLNSGNNYWWFTHAINAVTNNHGSITPGSGIVMTNEHSDESFTIAPDAHYYISDVLVDSLSIGATTEYTFTNVTNTHTIEADFANYTWTITAESGAHGSISPSGTYIAGEGYDSVFTITPNAHFHVSQVLVDGVATTETSSYTFKDVETNHTIEADFSQTTWTITSEAGTGGSISPLGANVTDEGCDATFTITPAAHYHLSQVLVDSVATTETGAGSYTFFNVSANHTIQPSFVYVNTPEADAFSAVTTTVIQANWKAHGNPAGTEYYCENTTAGKNSGWISALQWASTSLEANTKYNFRAKARIGSDESVWASLGTQETTGQISGDASIAGVSLNNGDTISGNLTITISMTGESATTSSGLKALATLAGIKQVCIDGVPVAYDITSSTSTAITLRITSPILPGTHSIKIIAYDTAGTEYILERSGLIVASGAVSTVGPTLLYPNPYNPLDGNLKITYYLSVDTGTTIYVFDTSGTMVWRSDYMSGVNGGKAGYNEILWNAVDMFGNALRSNDYIVNVVEQGSGKRITKAKLLVWRGGVK